MTTILSLLLCFADRANVTKVICVVVTRLPRLPSPAGLTLLVPGLPGTDWPLRPPEGEDEAATGAQNRGGRGGMTSHKTPSHITPWRNNDVTF